MKHNHSTSCAQYYHINFDLNFQADYWESPKRVFVRWNQPRGKRV